MWCIVFTTELNVITVERFVPDVVHNTTSNSATIDHDPVGVEVKVRLEYLVSQLDSIKALETPSLERFSIASLARKDNGRVLTKPSNVHAQTQRVHITNANITEHSSFHISRAKELHLADAREHSVDADAAEVGVISVGIDPPVDLGFVGEAYRSGVDLGGMPELIEETSRKTLLETSDITSRVSKYAPNNLSILIGKRTLSCFPNNVRNSASFVEDDQDSPTLVMQTSESLRVPFRPRYHIDAPGPFVFFGVVEYGSGREFEFIFPQEHVKPFT